MAEDLTENDLPQNLKKMYLQGVSALEVRNYGYAIVLLQAVVKGQPEFLTGRRQLRQAAIKQKEGQRKSLSSAALRVFKYQKMVEKDAIGAIAAIEKEVLADDPYSPQGNQVLFEAAQAAGLPLTAGFALETITNGHPNNTKYMHQLAEYYYNSQNFEKAAEVYSEIRKREPSDLVAIKMEKDATAKQSMASQKWEGGSFRELLKDKDEASKLEGASRAAMTPEMLQARAAELVEVYNQNQHDLNVSKQLADLYEQLEDWPNAAAFYSWAFSLSKNDPVLARKNAEMQERMAKLEVKNMERDLEENPEREDSEELRQRIAEMKKSQSAHLIDEARIRVERNPTDQQLRFEYGERLFSADQFRDAIPQLQQAKRSPSLRIQTMLMLGKCYERMNMNDLAAQQFEEATKEIPGMDDTKKELLYNLGMLHEKMGNKEAYLEALKQIYAADYGYRDVASRVESAYQEA